jgi:hypothetical protein
MVHRIFLSLWLCQSHSCQGHDHFHVTKLRVKFQTSSLFDLSLVCDPFNHTLFFKFILYSFHDTKPSWFSSCLIRCCFLVFANSAPYPWILTLGYFKALSQTSFLHYHSIQYCSLKCQPLTEVYQMFFFFVVLWFELRTSCLLGGCCTTWATLPTLFCVGYFRDRVSWIVCPGWPQTGFFLIHASWVVCQIFVFTLDLFPKFQSHIVTC